MARIILMSTSFAGWTAGDIVGRLKEAEVLGCLPGGWIRARDAQTWRVLDGVVLALLDSVTASDD